MDDDIMGKGQEATFTIVVIDTDLHYNGDIDAFSTGHIFYT